MTKKKSYKNQNITYNSNINKPSNDKSVKKETTSSRSISGIKGFQNLGNTCYFNSMLQMLINSPGFLSQLKAYCTTEQNIVVRLNQTEYDLVLKTTDVSIVEKELLSIWESDKENISPASLRTALLHHKDFKAHFNGFNEQDSHEVFLMVLNIIKESQIKRIRGAVLDYFNARKTSFSIDDDTKKKIKDISAVVEKQTLVNNLFGLVIGSNLKCQSCGELRMRFDEVFHITPVFVANHDSDKVGDKTMKNDDKEDQGLVIVKSKNQNVANEKMSKHQMKRQKRIEKKAARNKKSVQRNVECSPEEMNADSDAKINENDDCNDEEVREEDEAVDTTIMIGGNDEDMDDNGVIQQLIYDTVTEELLNRKEPLSSQCSSTNGSMVARKNDSSRVSMTSLTSSIEDVMCHEFSRDLSVHNDPCETQDVEEPMDNNSCIDVMDDDSDVDKMSSAGNIIRVNVDCEPRVDVCGDVLPEESNPGTDGEQVQNATAQNQEEVIDQATNVVIVDSYVGASRDKQFLQCAFSSALETHQDRIYSCHGQNKIAFECETDLDRALARFTMPMFLENIVCDNCCGQKHKDKTDHYKTDVICHLPHILPFYISRFKQCAARTRTKNTQVYSYPLVLNVSSQCSRFANFTSPSSPVLYRLFGIIEHIGARINTGHYVSYICRGGDGGDGATQSSRSTYPGNMLTELTDKYDHSRYQYQQDDANDDTTTTTNIDSVESQGQWFRISDSHVESVSRDTAMRVQAFMLFYSRIQ